MSAPDLHGCTEWRGSGQCQFCSSSDNARGAYNICIGIAKRLLKYARVRMLDKAHMNIIVIAGVVLLYLGAALLTVRLASEATTVYYERHLIWGGKFDR